MNSVQTGEKLRLRP